MVRLKRLFDQLSSKILRRKTYIIERRIVIQIRWTSHTSEWDVIEQLRGILHDEDFTFIVRDDKQYFHSLYTSTETDIPKAARQELHHRHHQAQLNQGMQSVLGPWGFLHHF